MIKKESRLKKASYSILFLGLYEITVFVCNLILPRMILVAYGSEYNGIVSSITRFLEFISILRVGVAGATRVELYQSLSTDDTKRTSGIVCATEIFMRKVAGIFLLYLAALAIFYPLIVESSYSYLEIASLIIIIGIGTFAQYFFGITYSTLLQADQKLYIYNIIQIVATILNTILSCSLIKLGFSIQIVKFASAIVFTISPIVLNIYVSKYYHLDKKVTPDETALNRKNDVVAHSVANIIHDNTDVVVLTLFTSVKTVSVYTVYGLVMTGLKQLTQVFTSSLEAAFGDMWARNDKERVISFLKEYEYLMGCFVSFVFSCAMVLILPFVSNYTSGVTDVNYIVPLYAVLAVLAQSFYCMRMPYITVVQAIGHYKETKNGAFLEAGINVCLSLLLTWKFGLVGVVIGTLAANVFRTIQLSIYVYTRVIPESLFRVFKIMIWTYSNVALSCLVFFFVKWVINLEITSWLLWLGGAVIVAAIAIIITIINSLLFYKQDFYNAVKLVKRLVKLK